MGIQKNLDAEALETQQTEQAAKDKIAYDRQQDADETTRKIEEAGQKRQDALDFQEAEDARRKKLEEDELRRIEREKQIIADATAAFEKQKEIDDKVAEWRQKNDCGYKDWRNKEYGLFGRLHWKQRMKGWGKRYGNMVEHWEERIFEHTPDYPCEHQEIHDYAAEQHPIEKERARKAEFNAKERQHLDKLAKSLGYDDHADYKSQKKLGDALARIDEEFDKKRIKEERQKQIEDLKNWSLDSAESDSSGYQWGDAGRLGSNEGLTPGEIFAKTAGEHIIAPGIIIGKAIHHAPGPNGWVVQAEHAIEGGVDWYADIIREGEAADKEFNKRHQAWSRGNGNRRLFEADSLEERRIREDSVHTHEILFVLGTLLSAIILFRIYRRK